MGYDAVVTDTIHRLYCDHNRWLNGWLRRRVDNGADAADLAQDVFVRALTTREADALREPRAFLTTLARRTLFTFWRRRDLEAAYLDALATLADRSVPSAEDQAQIQQALEAIVRQLAGLAPRARQAFLLHRLDGLSHPDIARTLGVSLATIERDMKTAWLHCWARRDSLPS